MSKPQPVAIVGIGCSPFARSLEGDGHDLAITACHEALGDAGLAPGDVDGVATYLGAYEHAELSQVIPGVGLIEERLKLREDLMALAPAAMTSIHSAVEAIRSGQCHTVLTYKANKWKRGVPPGAANNAPLVGGIQQFTVPYGHSMTAQWLALWAQRHFYEYGTTCEHLGKLVVTTRKHAGLNPRATMRTPLTLDDYYRSPWISEPFRKLDLLDQPLRRRSRQSRAEHTQLGEVVAEPARLRRASTGARRLVPCFRDHPVGPPGSGV